MRRRTAALAALTAVLFLVHAVPARDPGLRTGAVPVLPARVVAFALPGDFAPVPGQAFAWQAEEGDGLRRCRTVLTVGAEASDRGVRAAAGTLAYRFRGERRELQVAATWERGERRAWRGDLARARVGAPPVGAVVRFPAPAGLPPAVLVRATVDTFADTSSAVQRTPAYLASCAKQTRRRAPAALDALQATAEVVAVRP